MQMTLPSALNLDVSVLVPHSTTIYGDGMYLLTLCPGEPVTDTTDLEHGTALSSI